MEKIHFRSGFSIYSFHTPKWVLSWSIILELVHLHSVSISLNSRRSPSDGLYAPITLLDNDSFLKAWSSMLSFYIFEKTYDIWCKSIWNEVFGRGRQEKIFQPWTKIIGLALLPGPLSRRGQWFAPNSRQSILYIVFDTWSIRDISEARQKFMSSN